MSNDKEYGPEIQICRLWKGEEGSPTSALGFRLAKSEDGKADAEFRSGDRRIGLLWKSKSDNPKAPAYSGYLLDLRVTLWRVTSTNEKAPMFRMTAREKEKDGEGPGKVVADDFRDDHVPF